MIPETLGPGSLPIDAVMANRRRPGRVPRVDPGLLVLLRNSVSDVVPDGAMLLPTAGDRLERSTPRYRHGVLVQLVAAVVLWGVIGAAVWLVA